MRARLWLAGMACLCAGVAAHAEPLTVRTEDCRRLTAHEPAPDVAYTPGVDVHGNRVAPADLGGGYANMIPNEITLNIGIDLADRLGRARAHAAGQPPTTANRPLLPYTGTASIGTITVNGNRVLWNGEPLEAQDEAALAAACRASLAARTPPPPKPAPPPR